jgi:hypothetical protein
VITSSPVDLAARQRLPESSQAGVRHLLAPPQAESLQAGEGPQVGQAGVRHPVALTQVEGRTCLEYDKPSSLFGQFGNTEIAAVASMLDRKLEALVAAVQ